MSTTLMPKYVSPADQIRKVLSLIDDFQEFVSGDVWTDTSGDSGASVANVDAAGGVVSLTTGGTDNNECYLLSTKELFLFAAGKTLTFEARVKYAEANTDDANVAMGFMNAVGADSIVDDGAGLKTNFSGACFYKVDGGTKWNTIVSLGATQDSVLLSAANADDGVDHTAGGTAYHVFRIEVYTISSTEAVATFFIDGVQVQQHTFTYTSATEMNAFVANKAGGANSEVTYVDYIVAEQLR